MVSTMQAAQMTIDRTAPTLACLTRAALCRRNGAMLLPAVLVRAPLLRMDDKRAFADPLARAALALAQPDLPASATRARDNYAARARFRATPHGLWAGVGMARVGARTRLRTGTM